MEWFLNVQFFAGLIIGAAFAFVGGLLLGLVVGAPIASEIMAAEGAQGGGSIWHPTSAKSTRDADVIDMTPPRSERAKASATRSEVLDMTPGGAPTRRGDAASPLPPPPESGGAPHVAPGTADSGKNVGSR